MLPVNNYKESTKLSQTADNIVVRPITTSRLDLKTSKISYVSLPMLRPAVLNRSMFDNETKLITNVMFLSVLVY